MKDLRYIYVNFHKYRGTWHSQLQNSEHNSKKGDVNTVSSLLTKNNCWSFCIHLQSLKLYVDVSSQFITSPFFITLIRLFTRSHCEITLNRKLTYLARGNSKTRNKEDIQEIEGEGFIFSSPHSGSKRRKHCFISSKTLKKITKSTKI